jgi:hypothetical protein
MFRLMMRIGLALSLAWCGYEVLPRAMDAVTIFGFRDDPVQMLLYRLSGLDKPAYEKEIAAALAEDDPELARSLAELAESRGIAIDKETLQRIAEAEEFSLTRSAGQLWDGVVTGRADSPTAFAGALTSDLTVVGDVRDLVQQGLAYPNQDNLTVALAATGVVMTGALAMSGGTSAVGKVGVSAIKAAKRMGRLSKALERQLIRLTADAVDTRVLRTIGRDLGGWNFTAAFDEAKRLVKPRVIDEISETGGALRGVFARQGYRGTLQVLESAETTGDVRQLERMSDRLGGKFRGALFLKRGARLTFRFTELLFTVAIWLVSAGLWLLWAAYFATRTLWKAGKMLYRFAAFALKSSGLAAISSAIARLPMKTITRNSNMPAKAVTEPTATSG